MDRLGAEYCAAGHEVFLVVPGAYAQRALMPSGVVRISVPAHRIPFTGGYRAVLPRPVAALPSRWHLTPSRCPTASPCVRWASGAAGMVSPP